MVTRHNRHLIGKCGRKLRPKRIFNSGFTANLAQSVLSEGLWHTASGVANCELTDAVNSLQRFEQDGCNVSGLRFRYNEGENQIGFDGLEKIENTTTCLELWLDRSSSARCRQTPLISDNNCFHSR